MSSSIGAITSGGDSQGMNCVLYGLLESSSSTPTDVYLIHDGYRGMVDGSSSMIEKGNHEHVLKYLHQGGTIIGSSRCPEFRTAEGRQKAAFNLLDRNIQNLVVIGGDGTLTGANFLRQEWPKHVEEWRKVRSRDPQEDGDQKILNIVGIIGSIDNDFFGTEMTIGTDSALCRIVESIDTLQTTAVSHHRAMVVEVMGRNCGYLALSSALATEATYVFVPECPQANTEEWARKLRARVKFERRHNLLHHFIIVAEGACTANGTPIRADTVRDFLNTEFPGIDARTVVLGHTQRGGNTSAFDRLMSVQMGVEAFKLINDETLKTIRNYDDQASVLTINDGLIRRQPLMACVDQTTKLGALMKEKQWDQVLELRGIHFRHTWDNFKDLMSNSKVNESLELRPCWAVAHFGRPIPGMNAVLYALVRYAIAWNIKVLAAKNGLEGLAKDQFEEMDWNSVSGLASLSGSAIGSRSQKLGFKISSEESFRQVLVNLLKHKVKCLCLIGDQTALDLAKQFAGSSIKVCFIPACIDPTEDLPLAYCKLGFDSVLNKTSQLLNDLVLSTEGSHNQLALVKLNFTVSLACPFVELPLVAMANCATYCYPRDRDALVVTQLEAQDLVQVKLEANALKKTILETHRNHFVLIHKNIFNEVNAIYQATFANSNTAQSQINFTIIDLSQHLQMPMKPSPFDRRLGVKLGMRCGNYFQNSSRDFAKGPMLLTYPGFDLVPIDTSDVNNN